MTVEQTTLDRINEIRGKHLSELTEADKVFLRARQSYLGKRDQQKYAEVLSSDPLPAPRLTRKQQRLQNEEMKRLAHPGDL